MDPKSRIPPNLRHHLRECYQTQNGELIAYYVGTLKSYNSRNGYGFIDCPQAKRDWGADVFVHKNSVPNPWNVGQFVEFSVVTNNKGQPQAWDCNWLPRPKTAATVPRSPAPNGTAAQPTQQPAAASAPAVATASPDGLSSQGAQTGGEAQSSSSSTFLRPELQAPAPPPLLAAEPRKLGTLKSFSNAQGYGFISCQEVTNAFGRDVYLDKSQLPPTPPGWKLGQNLEFSVSTNSKGQPQARGLNWDPIPVIPLHDPRQAPPQQAEIPAHRGFKPQTLDRLKKLLKMLYEKNYETVLVTAIDFQGGSSAGAPDSKGETVDIDVDYVSFTLDRMGAEKDAVALIKDFVKMLLLLMLAKMLRTHTNPVRVDKIIRWFEALTVAIQISGENVQEHFEGVVDQILNHLKTAYESNPPLTQQEAHMARLEAVSKTLKDKLEFFYPLEAPSGPGPS